MEYCKRYGSMHKREKERKSVAWNIAWNMIPCVGVVWAENLAHGKCRGVRFHME